MEKRFAYKFLRKILKYVDSAHEFIAHLGKLLQCFCVTNHNVRKHHIHISGVTKICLLLVHFGNLSDPGASQNKRQL